MEIQDVHDIVCEYLDTEYDHNDNSKNHCRDTKWLDVRRMTTFLSKEIGVYVSLANLGKFYNKDHASALNLINKLNTWCKKDPKYKKYYKEIKRIINRRLSIENNVDYSKFNLNQEKENNETINSLLMAIDYFTNQHIKANEDYDKIVIFNIDSLTKKMLHKVEIKRKCRERIIKRYYEFINNMNTKNLYHER
jgi:hypothetical protein